MIKCHICGNQDAKLAYSLKLCKIYRCQKCNALFTDQDSLRHKQGKDMYSAEYFTETHPNFFKESSADYQKHLGKSKKLQAFLRELKILKRHKPKGKLLDIGCATGVFLDMAQKEGFDAYGVELSDYASKYAEEKFKLNVFNGKLEDSKFKKKMFDVITMWDFIEHVPDPVGILKKARELLKDDGIIVIQTTNDDSFMCKAADAIYKITGGLISKPSELVHPIHHITHFSRKTLLNMIKNVGLKPVHIETSEIPLDNVEGSSVLKAAVAVVYAIAWALNSPFEIKVIAKKYHHNLNK